MWRWNGALETGGWGLVGVPLSDKVSEACSGEVAVEVVRCPGWCGQWEETECRTLSVEPPDWLFPQCVQPQAVPKTWETPLFLPGTPRV